MSGSTVCRAHTGENDQYEATIGGPLSESETQAAVGRKTCTNTPVSSCKQKNTRGRPKKQKQLQCDLQHSLVSSMSNTEAQNTWNTAKLLGISTSDERAVVSNLRKSKRLLIMDGKPE